MNKNKIILLTGNNSFFGQTRKPWVGMNVEKIQNILEQNGFTVERYTFHEIVNRQERITDSLIFYTFSQKINRRIYINDLIHFLNSNGNILIPSYDLLKCHENKGFQEIYKKEHNIPKLNSYYFSSVCELDHYTINFPVVLKTIDGSNGKGVFLAKNREELIELVNKLERQNIFTRLDLLRRKYFRRKKRYKEYPDYSNKTDYIRYKDYIVKEHNFILQEFVPDLTYDYRVLVLYDKYYVTKRHTRKNDFRASGAKKFDFDFKANPKLLNYAKEVYGKFDTPFLSIDVIPSQNNYFLLEFQALHFGINVFVKNTGFFTLENDIWKFNKAKPDIETEMSTALVKYINARYN